MMEHEEDNERSFRALYDDHVGTVRRMLFRLCHANDVDDLVQETFVRVFRGFDGFQGQCLLSTWVYKIALNTARDHQRSVARRRWLSFLDPDELTETRGDGSADQRLAEQDSLRQAMAKLSPKHREVLVLFSIEELAIKEIAALLDVPEGTVKSRLNEARGRLKTFLEKIEI